MKMENLLERFWKQKKLCLAKWCVGSNFDHEKRAEARKLTEEFLAYMGKEYRAQSDGGHLGNSDDKERTIISYPVKWSEETKQFMVESAKKAGFPNVTGMDEARVSDSAYCLTVLSHRLNGVQDWNIKLD